MPTDLLQRFFVPAQDRPADDYHKVEFGVCVMSELPASQCGVCRPPAIPNPRRGSVLDEKVLAEGDLESRPPAGILFIWNGRGRRKYQLDTRTGHLHLVDMCSESCLRRAERECPCLYMISVAPSMMGRIRPHIYWLSEAGIRVVACRLVSPSMAIA